MSRVDINIRGLIKVGVLWIWSKLLRKLKMSSLRGCTIHNTAKVESGCNLVDVSMNRHSFCGYDCEMSSVKIGSFCSIANNVTIGEGEHPVSWVSTSPVFYEGRDSVRAKFSTHPRERVRQTVIGHDVWIGRNALIKQGVTIGNGAVIGMGSVVTRDIAPYMIVGVPARVIKRRFEQEAADRIELTRWWEMPDQDLNRYARVFCDPALFLQQWEKENG